MKKHLEKKLHLKGWSAEEIAHAETIIKHAEANRHPHLQHLENSLYWFTLIIGILGTVMLSIVLIPILIINNNLWSYLLTGVFGFLIGALIIIIIKDMHWLKSHHHLFISLLIPIVAIFNFFIVVNRVNLFSNSLGLHTLHDPIAIGTVYFVCFLIPYVLFLLFKRR